MKTLICLLGFSVPIVSFSQSQQLIDSINKLIGPGYILDIDTLPPYHSYCSFDETDLNYDGVKEIIIAASNTNSAIEINKIFVLARTHNALSIIDTSAAFEVDGHGPRAEINGKFLTIIHGFSHGYNCLTYQFNTQLNKYKLSKLSYSFIKHYKPDKSYGIDFNEEYDVKGQKLAIHTRLLNYQNDHIDKEKTKGLSINLGERFSVMLAKMKDPYDYYDVFLTEGKLYDEMMKY